MYELAADLTLIIHFTFILFVIFGALLFFITTKIIFIHIPAFIWGSYIELTNSIISIITSLFNSSGLSTISYGITIRCPLL